MKAKGFCSSDYLQSQQLHSYWSENKFREMESALTGYWSKDIWDGKDNPYKNKERTSLILNFEDLPYIFKTEIKYVIYVKMFNYEWSWNTVHVNNCLKVLINSIKSTISFSITSSIIEQPYSLLELKLKKYFSEQGKLYSVTLHTCNKYGQPQFYESKDQKLYIFHHIYGFLVNFYDIRDEYDKDVWDINKLKPNARTKERYLNFTELKNLGFSSLVVIISNINWLFMQAIQYIIRYDISVFLATLSMTNTHN